MAAFLKLGDIKGEATDQDHKEWILLKSLSSSIHRSIPAGSKDNQRARGDTTLGDIVLVRQMDKSSTKIAEACASGKPFAEAEIHLCTNVHGKQEPNMIYKVKDVIVTGYSFHGTENQDPAPSEEITVSFTEIEWNYIVIDPKTLQKKGNVPGKYNPGAAKAG